MLGVIECRLFNSAGEYRRVKKGKISNKFIVSEGGYACTSSGKV